VSVTVVILGGVIQNIQTAAYISDSLAEGTVEQFTSFFGGNFSNWQHKFKRCIFY
jgi:hypothetical protein